MSNHSKINKLNSADSPLATPVQGLRRRFGVSLLVGFALLLGWSVQASAQSFPNPVTIGNTPNTDTLTLYYRINVAITPLVLPAASGVTGLTYTLRPNYESLGLTFNPTTRTLSGTPNVAGASRSPAPSAPRAGFKSSLEAEGSGSQFASLDVAIFFCESGGATDGVTGCTPPPYVGLVLPSLPTLFYVVDQPIALTLPAATGGTGANPRITYRLTGPNNNNLSQAPGLTFDRTTRVLSGTPTVVGTTILSYRVGDVGSSASIFPVPAFNITIVNALTVPTPSAQAYPFNAAITDLTLPVAIGGTGPYTYALTGPSGAALPVGLTFAADTRTLSGTPTTAGVTELSYTATDTSNGVQGTVTFNVTIIGLTFLESVGVQIFEVDTALPALTLPAATRITGTATYALTGPNGTDLTEVPGLAFDANTRILSGTPTVSAETELTYTVADGSATTDTQTFTALITSAMFVDDATVADQTYTVSQQVDMTLPAAVGASLNYTLTGPSANLPGGLSFDASTRVLSGTVTSEADATELTYTATATNSVAAINFTVTIVPRPAFADGTQIFASANYNEGRVAPVLTLPEATGGFAPLTYSLDDIPSGLVFDTITRTLSGVPNTQVTPSNLTYSVRDANDVGNDAGVAGVSLTFRIDSSNRPSVIALVDDQIYVVGVAIPTLTLPQFDNVSAFDHALTGPGAVPGGDSALPAGLSFAINDRGEIDGTIPGGFLTGTPTTPGVTVLTLTGSANNHSTVATVTFSVTVTADPYFAVTVPNQGYIVGTAITRLALPVALPVSQYDYTLLGSNGGALPAGLGYNLDGAGMLSSTPTEVGVTNLIYTATDRSTNATTSLTFSVTVRAAGDNQMPLIGDLSSRILANPHSVVENIDLSAYFMDPDGDPLTYTATPENDNVVAIVKGNLMSLIIGPSTASKGVDVEVVATDVFGLASNTPSTVPPLGRVLNLNLEIVIRHASGVAMMTTLHNVALDTGGGRDQLYRELNPNMDTLFDHFERPPDGGELVLRFEVESSAENIVLVSVEESTPNGGTDLDLMLTPIRAGEATITVNGFDFYGDPTNPPSATFIATVTGESMLLEVPEDLFKFAIGRVTSVTLPEATLPAAIAGTGIDHNLAYAVTGSNGADLSEFPWLTFANATRVLSGQPPEGTLVGDTFDVTYAVSDDTSGDAIVEFPLTIAIVEPVLDTEEIMAINEVLIPDLVRTMTGQTSNAITQRIEQARSGSGGGVTLAGQSSFADLATTHGKAMTEGTGDMKSMLNGSGFTLPLNAVGGGVGVYSPAFWGSGGYEEVSGDSVLADGKLDWDGDVTSFSVGMDAHLRNELLGGIAITRNEADVEYDVAGDVDKSDYELTMTSINPYLGWSVGQLDLWATVGYGIGDLEITDNSGTDSTDIDSDVDTQTFAGGGAGTLIDFDNGGALRLKGEISQTWINVDGDRANDIRSLDVDVNRIRVSLEARQPWAISNAASMESTLEAGARHDGGDGETGAGIELNAGLRYHNPVQGLTLEGNIHTLIAREDYNEWGINGTIILASGQDGQGLSLSLSPGYGEDSDGLLWDNGLSEDAIAETDYGMRLKTRIGYGLSAPHGWDGMLTPYSEMTIGNTNSYRFGVGWETNRYGLDLVGEHRQGSENAALLKGEIRF